MHVSWSLDPCNHYRKNEEGLREPWTPGVSDRPSPARLLHSSRKLANPERIRNRNRTSLTPSLPRHDHDGPVVVVVGHAGPSPPQEGPPITPVISAHHAQVPQDAVSLAKPAPPVGARRSNYMKTNLSESAEFAPARPTAPARRNPRLALRSCARPFAFLPLLPCAGCASQSSTPRGAEQHSAPRPAAKGMRGGASPPRSDSASHGASPSPRVGARIGAGRSVTVGVSPLFLRGGCACGRRDRGPRPGPRPRGSAVTSLRGGMRARRRTASPPTPNT